MNSCTCIMETVEFQTKEKLDAMICKGYMYREVPEQNSMIILPQSTQRPLKMGFSVISVCSVANGHIINKIDHDYDYGHTFD